MPAGRECNHRWANRREAGHGTGNGISAARTGGFCCPEHSECVCMRVFGAHSGTVTVDDRTATAMQDAVQIERARTSVSPRTLDGYLAPAQRCAVVQRPACPPPARQVCWRCGDRSRGASIPRSLVARPFGGLASARLDDRSGRRAISRRRPATQPVAVRARGPGVCAPCPAISRTRARLQMQQPRTLADLEGPHVHAQCNRSLTSPRDFTRAPARCPMCAGPARARRPPPIADVHAGLL
jgi:hypothetical protein